MSSNYLDTFCSHIIADMERIFTEKKYQVGERGRNDVYWHGKKIIQVAGIKVYMIVNVGIFNLPTFVIFADITTKSEQPKTHSTGARSLNRNKPSSNSRNTRKRISTGAYNNQGQDQGK